MVTC
ncbi:sulfatase domain protein, partial [Vibrio parahaemolyticus V-223/04]